MTDIRVNFPTFKRLIKQGRHSGPIFESKNTVLTSVGSLTVMAQKPAKDKFFTKDFPCEYNAISFPFLSRGYTNISMNTEKPLDDNGIIEAMIEESDSYSDEALQRSEDAITKLLAARRNKSQP